MAEINVAIQGNFCVVTVNGRVDSMNGSEFGESLLAQINQGHVNLVLDFASVDYMSSAGLREIVNTYRKARHLSGDLCIAAPTERVREVMEMSGLDTFIVLYESLEEALDQA
jgi:anti-anti-sigma factor